ncbi:hypothetical protein N7470_008319 [Penicillium chermesinum]|nr:hypothetical protein N7470_008319 [Penicillium chermesinum]
MGEKLQLGQGRPFPPPLPDAQDYIVDFDGPDDPKHPYNWRIFRKLFASILVCSGTFIVSLTSAIFAPGLENASAEFGVSSEVGQLGTTLYVLGFASGPMLWAPASELSGRKWPLTIAMLGGGIFTIGSAASKDIQTLIICRFFAGMCGASQLTVVPGVLADVFDNTYRGMAISLYALTVFVGPFTAPFIGGFITASYLGWRWTLYLPAVLSLANGAISLFILEETYPPCLLVTKAALLRKQTGNWGIHAKQEKIEIEFLWLLEKYFTRPLKMLITEPIILLVSLYMSFIYGLVYALLEAYPLVFQAVHGMEHGIDGLPFIGLTIGQVMACSYIISQHKGFGWTGFTPAIHWAAPTCAGIFIGFGVLCVFLPCFNYLVDSYLPLAASTVAANIILRSSVAAGFPLFTKQMFQNMGIQWASTLLGCLAAIMIPIPIAFRAYGPALRKKSKLFP